MMNNTLFVVCMGITIGVGGYQSIVNPDWIMGFLFGLICCLASGGVYLAAKKSELLREMDLTDAKLEVLKELQS